MKLNLCSRYTNNEILYTNILLSRINNLSESKMKNKKWIAIKSNKQLTKALIGCELSTTINNVMVMQNEMLSSTQTNNIGFISFVNYDFLFTISNVSKKEVKIKGYKCHNGNKEFLFHLNIDKERLKGFHYRKV